MKRKLLALMAVAALPALGQAQTNIVLYGSIDVSVESRNADANGGVSDIAVSNGVWAGSRFAISGSEDLGGGLKGIFNLEHRLSPDTGTVTSGATFWAGQAWVGLQRGGRWAAVRRSSRHGREPRAGHRQFPERGATAGRGTTAMPRLPGGGARNCRRRLPASEHGKR